LAVDAGCVDAYLFLAMANADRPEKAMEFAFEALRAGDQAVEDGSDAADEGHLWSHLPARSVPIGSLLGRVRPKLYGPGVTGSISSRQRITVR
jgi:hypothetical protein